MTLDKILSLLAMFHNAQDRYLNSDYEHDCEIAQEVCNLQDRLEDLAPSWFKEARIDDGLYNTDLAGDPSIWDPHAITELCVCLAIGNLPNV